MRTVLHHTATSEASSTNAFEQERLNSRYHYGLEMPPSSIHSFTQLAIPRLLSSDYQSDQGVGVAEQFLNHARKERTRSVHRVVADLVRYTFGDDWRAEVSVFQRPTWKVKVTYSPGVDDEHANRPWLVYETVNGERVGNHLVRCNEWERAQAVAWSVAMGGPGHEAQQVIAQSPSYEFFDERAILPEEPKVVPHRPGWDQAVVELNAPKVAWPTQRTMVEDDDEQPALKTETYAERRVNEAEMRRGEAMVRNTRSRAQEALGVVIARRGW